MNLLREYEKLMDLIDKYDNAFHPSVTKQVKKCVTLRNKERQFISANTASLQ
jgi:hypothetical protein